MNEYLDNATKDLLRTVSSANLDDEGRTQRRKAYAKLLDETGTAFKAYGFFFERIEHASGSPVWSFSVDGHYRINFRVMPDGRLNGWKLQGFTDLGVAVRVELVYDRFEDRFYGVPLAVGDQDRELRESGMFRLAAAIIEALNVR